MIEALAVIGGGTLLLLAAALIGWLYDRIWPPSKYPDIDGGDGYRLDGLTVLNNRHKTLSQRLDQLEKEFLAADDRNDDLMALLESVDAKLSEGIRIWGTNNENGVGPLDEIDLLAEAVSGVEDWCWQMADRIDDLEEHCGVECKKSEPDFELGTCCKCGDESGICPQPTNDPADCPRLHAVVRDDGSLTFSQPVYTGACVSEGDVGECRAKDCCKKDDYDTIKQQVAGGDRWKGVLADPQQVLQAVAQSGAATEVDEQEDRLKALNELSAVDQSMGLYDDLPAPAGQDVEWEDYLQQPVAKSGEWPVYVPTERGWEVKVGVGSTIASPPTQKPATDHSHDLGGEGG